MGVTKGVSAVTRAIDLLNEWVARCSFWLVLILTLETAISAIVLKVFDVGSNAFIEIRWYLFSAIFLFGAGYTLQKNAHVRIDVIAGRFGRRVQACIDIFGTLAFMFPLAVLMIWMSWGVFVDSFVTGEVSSSAGGLILWPARLMVPLGFGLLFLQGLAEILKRVLFLCGTGPDPLDTGGGPSAEEELAEEIRRSRQGGKEGAL